MTWDIAIILCVTILVFGIIFLQKAHYKFILKQDEQLKIKFNNEEINEFNKQFDDYKRRVDAICIKQGFTFKN